MIKDVKEYDSLFNSGILEGTVFGDIEVMIENSVDMAYAENVQSIFLRSVKI